MASVLQSVWSLVLDAFVDLKPDTNQNLQSRESARDPLKEPFARELLLMFWPTVASPKQVREPKELP